jgi:hypothetical protein
MVMYPRYRVDLPILAMDIVMAKGSVDAEWSVVVAYQALCASFMCFVFATCAATRFTFSFKWLNNRREVTLAIVDACPVRKNKELPVGYLQVNCGVAVSCNI